MQTGVDKHFLSCCWFLPFSKGGSKGIFPVSCKYNFLLFRFSVSAISDKRVLPLEVFLHSALVYITLQETKG